MRTWMMISMITLAGCSWLKKSDTTKKAEDEAQVEPALSAEADNEQEGNDDSLPASDTGTKK